MWLSSSEQWFHSHLMTFLSSIRNENFSGTLWRSGTVRIDEYLRREFFSFPGNRKLLDSRVYLGKLGFKPEPAGKIRVFAMVDSWTQ